MPMSRRFGGISSMACPSMNTDPLSACSKPATMRRAVVLPQPLGPRKLTNSPSAMSSDRPSSAVKSP